MPSASRRRPSRAYIEAARWFAAEHLLTQTDLTDWAGVTGKDVQRWIVRLLAPADDGGFGYSDSYANNQYRALQQFFKWWSDDEDLPDPMATLHPPKVDDKVVPVFTDEELAKLKRACEGRTFVQRRDRAIISLFRATGIRLSKLAGIRYDPDDPEKATSTSSAAKSSSTARAASPAASDSATPPPKPSTATSASAPSTPKPTAAPCGWASTTARR